MKFYQKLCYFRLLSIFHQIRVNGDIMYEMGTLLKYNPMNDCITETLL